MITLQITERERDTIIAALFAWQERIFGCEVSSDEELIKIAQNDRTGEDAMLSKYEIDDLDDRINVTRVTLTKRKERRMTIKETKTVWVHAWRNHGQSAGFNWYPERKEAWLAFDNFAPDINESHYFFPYETEAYGKTRDATTRAIDGELDQATDAAAVFKHGPLAKPKKIKFVCPRCGSSEIRSDASAMWSIDKQDWELVSLLDNKDCDGCGADDIHPDAVAVVDLTKLTPKQLADLVREADVDELSTLKDVLTEMYNRLMKEKD